jgi:hypothetical protein
MIYRDLGLGRSIRKAYQKHRLQNGGGTAAQRSGSTPGYWFDWATRHDWGTRTQAFDHYLDRQVRIAQVEARRNLQVMQEAGTQIIVNKIIESSQDIDFEQLKPTDLVNCMCKVFELQRVIQGEPINIESHRMSGATDEPPIKHRIIDPSPFDPSPEFMAEVMQILHERGVVDCPDEAIIQSQSDDDGNVETQASPQSSVDPGPAIDHPGANARN